MAKTLQFRRGTTSELSSVTGAVGELFVDTTKDTVVVMDGATSGGFALSRESATITAGSYANSAFSKANTAQIHAQAAFNAANTGGGSGADLSQVAEDIVPLFSEVYDIGATDKRWYDVYVANNLDINGSQLTAAANVLSTTSDFVAGSLLADDILISDNMITPDDATAREYLGSKGIVIVNGNLDVQGDWIKTPIVETVAEIIGSVAGQTDSNFTVDILGAVKDVVVQTDGKILVAGSLFRVNGVTGLFDNNSGIVRLNADGSTDTSFDMGTGFNGSVNKIALRSDGKILAGGQFTSVNGATRTRIALLNNDGSLNASMFSGGSGFDDEVNEIVPLIDGSILVGGNFTQYTGQSTNRFVRLNSDGSRNDVFHNNLGTGPGHSLSGSSAVKSVKVNSDGTMFVAGSFNTWNGVNFKCLVKLNSDGTRNIGFTNTGLNIGVTSDYDSITDIDTQSDGKILAVGSFGGGNIFRLTEAGIFDNTFDSNIGNGFGGTTFSCKVQSDDKILVGGEFTTFNWDTTNRIVRLNASGTKDTTFDVGSGGAGFNNSVFGITLLQDDKIAVFGEFTTYRGLTNRSLVLINAVTIDSVPPQEVSTTGEAGLIRYNADNTNNDQLELHNGTAWIPVSLGDNVVYSKIISEEEAPITNTVDIEIPSDDGRYELQINNYGVYQENPNTLYRQWRMELITTCEDDTEMEWKGTRIQLGQPSGDSSSQPDDAIMFFESEVPDINYRYNLSLDINIVGNCGTITSEFITFDYGSPGFNSFKNIYATTNMGVGTLSRPKTIRLRGNFSGGDRRFAAGTEFKLIKK